MRRAFDNVRIVAVAVVIGLSFVAAALRGGR
jgi:hypothetical protein